MFRPMQAVKSCQNNKTKQEASTVTSLFYNGMWQKKHANCIQIQKNIKQRHRLRVSSQQAQETMLIICLFVDTIVT